MSNGKHVNADPESVRGLARALARYQREVADAGRRVRGALTDARWKDPQKDDFERHYQDLQQKLDRFMEREVQDMIKSLNRLAGQLEEILDKRM
jgi:hypothetical protein